MVYMVPMVPMVPTGQHAQNGNMQYALKYLQNQQQQKTSLKKKLN